MPTAWPGTVPRRFRLGANYTGPENSVIETQFDKGRPQRRRNTLAAPSMVSLELVEITYEELAAFEAWFETTLSGGSLTFEMGHPITRVSREWAFPSGTPYTYTQINHERVNVSLNLMLYPYAD